ncbi:hypothetical protein HB364_21990 [Pseudoflavitalea sp. X16]|uniref:hypothetical protein n=1 Tax=Paraflavitalea devenefica TaxID=2716334 RepID=UPI001420A80A|nr:hypothetical protein [Paraflavitalea devenefica]NII27770.1 hypothetical protein [Paraflavitalea devenefica]
MKNEKRSASALSPLGKRMTSQVITSFTKEVETYSYHVNNLTIKRTVFQNEMNDFHRHFNLYFKTFFSKKEQMAYKSLVKATNKRGLAVPEAHTQRLAYLTELLDCLKNHNGHPFTGGPGHPTGKKIKAPKTMKLTGKSRKPGASNTAPFFPGFPRPSNAPAPVFIITFVNHIIHCLRQLQTQSIRQPGVRMTQAGKGKREEHIRDILLLYLSGHYAHVSVEVLKGNGRIDIVAYDKVHNIELKLEVKGWWNPRKIKIITQILGYLTEFEDYAFVIVINDTKKDIRYSYQNIVVRKKNQFIPGSWKNHVYPGTSYTYYSSEHEVGSSIKKIYHFIFSL